MTVTLACGPLPVATAIGIFVHQDGTQKDFCILQEPKAWLSHSVSEPSSSIALCLTLDSEYFVHLLG